MTNWYRFYRYLANDGISTAAHYLILHVLVQMGIESMFGSTTTALAGLVFNYSVSRRWVFDASAKTPETLARLALVWMLALLINAWALTSLLALGFRYLVAQVTATRVLVLTNPNLHCRWTFSGARVPPLDK